MRSICVCKHACMHVFAYFYINLYISFIYEDILTKFAENVYGCENMSVKNFVSFRKKQNVGLIIAYCLKIINMF